MGPGNETSHPPSPPLSLPFFRFFLPTILFPLPIHLFFFFYYSPFLLSTPLILLIPSLLGKDIGALISNVGSGAAAAAATTSAAPAGGGGGEEEEKKEEEKKEESEEESDDDMGFGEYG